MYSFYSFETSDLRRMPRRRDESNKGDYGKLLCVCGSRGMSGAAFLCAKAAYRTGVGLVRILTAEDNRIPLQTSLPEAIVSTYDFITPDVSYISDSVTWADAVVIGCGLGVSDTSKKVLCAVLDSACGKPLIVDADALNMISADECLREKLSSAIITPHPLEASRLSGLSVDEILSDTPRAASELSNELGVVCVIKRHETVVSDGSTRIYVNNSGNHGMATGGSGDVLAGITGAIAAQNKSGALSPMDVAALSVYVHGLAGDFAAENVGEYSLMASDIIDHLPAVLKNVGKPKKTYRCI